MKKIAALTLLAVYLNASAQLLLPFVSDCLAHIFFYKAHLEHVHHGQMHSHHVADEMATLLGEDDHEHSSAPHPAVVFHKDALSAHVMPTLDMPTPDAFASATPPAGPWLFAYPSECGEVLFPPPDWA